MATSGGSGGGPGGTVVRKFPFAHNTLNLLAGAPMYVPSVGDLLLDGWIEVDTAWNGTTPHGDFGTFVPVLSGWIGAITGGETGSIDMTAVDLGPNGETSVLAGGGLRRLLAVEPTTDALFMGEVNGAGPDLKYQTGGLLNGDAGLPYKFVTNTSVKVVVSTDGTATVAATALADAPPTLPLTIVLNTNDQFVYTGDGGAGSPMTFKLAPGTYTTIGQVIAAMAAALDGATVFDTLVTPSNDGGLIKLTMVGNGGTANNGNTITAGNGGAAALGFTGNPDTFANGSGGDPVASEGAGILYLVTATPV